jgi:hydroxymethylglutaryl-CoA reductase
MSTNKTSQLPEFYSKSIAERRHLLSERTPTEIADIRWDEVIDVSYADHMVENVVDVYCLPFAIATNFLIGGKDYLIPMVIEEPSVVAAASFAAKLIRQGGGFRTTSDEPLMIGQIQILDCPDIQQAIQNIHDNRQMLLDAANQIGGSIIERGGGARDIEVRVFDDTPLGQMLVLHLICDVRDAMGANAVNTAVEYIAPSVEDLTQGRVHLKILSNLSDLRKASAECTIPQSALATQTMTGAEAVQSIVEASIFAEVDPYRATTNNKGVMNGIDAVVIATGNDWRAVEAGAHAYVARGGSYGSMTTWRENEAGDLIGRIELPMAVGIIGGTTRSHPTAQLALKLLDVKSARELAEVIVCVGLAQNLGAIRALAMEGIQQGHMRMHAKQLALSAGASQEMVPLVVDRLVREKNIRLENAKIIVRELQEKHS